MLDALAVLLAIPASICLVIGGSLFLDGVDRKLHARMQGRIGPPLLQPVYDLGKLMRKEETIPSTATKPIFQVAPFLSISFAIAGSVIPVLAQFFQLSFGGDIIVVMYLLAMPSIMKILAGAASGNPYGAIGFSREVSMLVAYEVPLVCAVFLVSFSTGTGITCMDFIRVQQSAGMPLAFMKPSLFLAGVLFMTCIAPAIGAVPYDAPEAKSEIVYGALIEYSGTGLALMKLSRWIRAFALFFLAGLLFFNPSFTALPMQSAATLLSGFVILIACPVLMIFSVTIPRTITSRLRIGQTFSRFWKIFLVFLIVAIVLSTFQL